MFTYAESYPLYPVFAFLGFVLVLIPLPWHFQAWNAGTCLFMIWTALACLNNFINSIVWRDNITDWAPVWCDISTRITIGVSVAIPAASLCINRRLYQIAACKTVSVTKAEKRRAVMVDCAIGLGIPVLQMALQYVVQGHRYNLMEGIGCYPTTYNTPLAYPLSYLWPNIIGLVSAVYCILTLCEFNRRRAQFALFLSASSSSSPLSLSRYFRLMALATIELLFNTPISAYGLYLTITHDAIRPWVSWANTHYEFSVIDVYPAIVWRSSPATVVTIELSRWAVVFCAFVFFGFFGFAAEARKHYRAAFWAVATRLGHPPPADGVICFPWTKAKSTPTPSAVLSVALPRTPHKQRPDSLSPSLADSATDVDADSHLGLEKRDYVLPSPSSAGSAPPEYGHDIEMGVYAARPASLASSTRHASECSQRTLDARARPYIPDAFYPSASVPRPSFPVPPPTPTIDAHAPAS